MAPPAPPPAPPPADDASVAVPAMFACVGMGIGAIAFGAGYGARSYFSTAAYKELVEKFPDLPTAEAEAAARKGATRAFLGGTALCGAFGLGAIITARMYGIKSAADFAEEIKKWLPTQAKLEVRAARSPKNSLVLCSLALSLLAQTQTVVVPKIAPLQRTVTEHLQGARNAASGQFQKSELGRRLSERAQSSTKVQTMTEEEKRLIAQLEGTATPTPPKK